MKYSLFVALFFISSLIYSQATPQWLFPIWFEDANGDRDTVYIGYDPDANLISGVFDEEFEDYIWVDTSKFNVLINSGSPSPYTGDYNVDSGKTIEVVSGEYEGFDIDFIKGKMPIIMYWDMSLFYSSNLPYPDLSPYPNAVGLVYCNAGEPGYVNCPSAFDDDPLSMVDSINVYYKFPIASPHLFDGSGIPPYDEPEEVLGSFVVAILPFEIYNSILYIDYNPNEVIPNPFTDYIRIQGDDYISLINLYNIFGQIIKTIHPINTYSYVLLTEDLQNGIYYLEVEKNKKRKTYIILKQ